MITQRTEGLVSAIIVTYKQLQYLYETIDSVLFQTYPKIEIIIADDGTTDFDVKQVERYVYEHNRGNIDSVVVFSNEKNMGTVKNENKALELSKGEYIKLIGGDDTYYDCDIFEKQIKRLEEATDLYAVISKAQQCDENLIPIHDDRVEKSNAAISDVINMTSFEARKHISKNNIFPIAIQATCFRAAFFIDKGMCDEDYIVIDDAPTVLRMLDCTDRLSFLDCFSVNHRTKVGVSSTKEFLPVRQLYYYRDEMTYYKKEVIPYPEIYGRLSSYIKYRRAKFFYKYIDYKAKKRKIGQFFICIAYLDVIGVYVLLSPKRFFYKIKGVLGK